MKKLKKNYKDNKNQIDQLEIFFKEFILEEDLNKDELDKEIEDEMDKKNLISKKIIFKSKELKKIKESLKNKKEFNLDFINKDYEIKELGKKLKNSKNIIRDNQQFKESFDFIKEISLILRESNISNFLIAQENNLDYSIHNTKFLDNINELQNKMLNLKNNIVSNKQIQSLISNDLNTKTELAPNFNNYKNFKIYKSEARKIIANNLNVLSDVIQEIKTDVLEMNQRKINQRKRQEKDPYFDLDSQYGDFERSK